MQLDSHNKFSHITISLHWLVAIMIIGLLSTGLIMEEFELFALYPWHKSFGVLVLLLIALRVAWRIKNGWPSAAGEHKKIERILAKAVHWLLIIGMILMPVSGFMMSAMGGHGVLFFGWELIAQNPDLNNPGKVIALNASLAEIGHTMHGLVGNVLIFAILLHIVGALKHHILDKDGTLRRMLGAKI